MDITNLCRGCMTELTPTEEENLKTTLEMFCFCTNILVGDDETLPQQFCCECKKSIESAFAFIKRAQNVNITLRNLTCRNTSVIVPNKQKDSITLTLPSYKLCVGVSNDHKNEIINSNKPLSDTNHSKDSLLPAIKPDSNDQKASKPNICPICKKGFMFKSWLSKHMEECSYQEFFCAICTKRFQSKSKLSQHLLIHSEERKFSCSTCGRQYKRRKHLTTHIKTHSTDRPFACEKCPKKFKLKKILQSHMKLHDPVKQYLCSFCGWSNNLAMNLEAHLRTHTGAKPYSCDVCEFRTAAACSLRRHRLRHAQCRPHVCTRCGKAFYDSSALMRHTRTHTGELPYKCAWCPRAFVDSWKRKNHLIRAHGLALEEIPRMRKDGGTY
ncbi:unnamed protein product [Leptosia nina]|uniref:Uncharacterized protein n=1 Tax=Leptosia nina TaxID=320188 RepID=A0AAV1JF96_9NEOP